MRTLALIALTVVALVSAFSCAEDLPPGGGVLPGDQAGVGATGPSDAATDADARSDANADAADAGSSSTDAGGADGT